MGRLVGTDEGCRLGLTDGWPDIDVAGETSWERRFVRYHEKKTCIQAARAKKNKIEDDCIHYKMIGTIGYKKK